MSILFSRFYIFSSTNMFFISHRSSWSFWFRFCCLCSLNPNSEAFSCWIYFGCSHCPKSQFFQPTQSLKSHQVWWIIFKSELWPRRASYLYCSQEQLVVPCSQYSFHQQLSHVITPSKSTFYSTCGLSDSYCQGSG